MKKGIAALILIAILVTLNSCGDETESQSQSTAITGTALTTTTAVTETESSEEADLNKSEFIIYEDRIFFISKTSEESQNTFAEAVNTVVEAMPEGINTYLMIAPMRIAFEVDEVQDLSCDQQQEIKNIYMSIDSSVTLVDAYYALSLHADPLDDIYYHTDRHWTHLGSYYAVQAFFEAAGISYHTIDEYTEYDGGEFLGYLQDLANDATVAENPDDFIYYLLPDTNRTALVYFEDTETGELVEHETQTVDLTRDGYEQFLWEVGFSHVIIEGEETSERAILVIGNSYASCITTWLADSFHTVVLVDPRYFEGGMDEMTALLDEYSITDLLVMASTSDSVSLTDDFSYAMTLLVQ